MSTANAARSQGTRPMKVVGRVMLVIAAVVFVVIFIRSGYTIVYLDEAGKPIGLAAEFDAVVYVDSIWDSEVIPTVRDRAVELSVLMQALADNADAAKEQYGRQDAAAGPYYFLARGEGRVLIVEADNMLVDLLPYDGEADVSVRLGPAFTGTEIRDALAFIRFNDFKNVLEYAAVSNQLNARVRNTVVSEIDKDTIAGKEITFAGAFALRDSDAIVVIPVMLEVTTP